MCGIAGYIGSAELERGHIEECLGLMRRRGPDWADWRSAPVGPGRRAWLLHSRLSIIDLDPRSRQPFQRGSRLLAYNGELYNYLEVRQALAGLGEQFCTTSDTEVMLAQLIRHGWQGLDACEGMWALAMLDLSDGSLLLARDRFGEKPLYLHRCAHGLYFGSEPKFIFALLGKRLPINHDHLKRFLVNGYKALYKVPDTFFVGMEELEPGTVLRVSGEGIERQRYWERRPQIDPGMEYDQAVARVRQAVIDSVRLRLRADVPLAFCMSGGIDSNSLISVAKRVFNYDVHGFTIVNTDARYEEQEMVDLAVRELGIRHTPIPVNTERFLPRMRELVAYHDAPIYTISYYAHWLLMQAIASHGYRISVSGTAADELFTGYYDHHNFYLQAVHDLPGLYARSLAAWREHLGPIVRNPYLRDPEVFVRDPGERRHIYLDADGFAAYLHQPWSEDFSEQDYHPEPLRRRMLNELFHESVPVILHEDDLNAMYYSIENRSPFLDRGLCELSWSIPTRHLVRDGRAKAVLRDAMAGIVPQPILDNRRKVGFNAPIFDFLDRRDPEVRRELLAPSPVFELVRRDMIEQLLEQEDLPNSKSKFLFYFISAKMFLEELS